MKAVIVSCGTELVTGQSVDTNSAWISQRLTAKGVEVVEHVTVGDELERVVAAIHLARQVGELVVITGGLGPTADDLTREALAAALGRPLESNTEAMRQLEEFFHRVQREMPESNKVQAMIPQGCEVIANPRGTAPGIAWWPEGGEARVIALPGVPGEMKAMFEAFVEPRLGNAGGLCTLAAKVCCFGISEARLGELIADLMARGRNPIVGTTASQAVLSVRILATAPTPEAAKALIHADIAEVRRRLADAAFGEGDDTMQQVVVKLLSRRNETVTTVESCTGGMLAKMVTDVPGSSAIFREGLVVYANEAKTKLAGVSPELIAQHGAVSAEVARALACGARERSGATYALSTTGIAGPGGGTEAKPVGLVFLGLAWTTGVDVRRVLLGSHLTRDEIRDRACRTVLNMLRLKMLRE